MAVDEIFSLLSSLAAGIGIDPGILAVVILAFLLILILVVVTFIGYFRTLLLIAQFAFPVARVKAIGNPFVRHETVSRLQDLHSPYEATTVVQEAGAGIEIPLDVPPERLDMILDEWYTREFLALLETVPDGIAPFFHAFQGVLEVEQLVRVVRAVHARQGGSSRVFPVIPIGTLTPGRIRELEGQKTLREIAAHLKDTPYGEVMSAALTEYDQTKLLLFVENALWKHALQQLHLSRQHVDPSLLPSVAGFLGLSIDVTNILTLLRAKAAGIPSEIVSGWFIPGGAVYEEWRLGQIYEARGPRDIIAQLSGTEYYTVLSPALPPGEDVDISRAELALDRLLLARVTTISQVHHLQGGPLIRFAIARKYEKRNLRVIFHSLLRGIPMPEAGQWLVVEGDVP
ncbi:MAG: V-type ATPase subunit [Methanolinea sp.]|nr:V-type ATPase subunit [Methanolinea sp.]